MNDSTTLYLDRIGKVPLLTKEEEVSLAKTIELGNSAQAKIDAGDTHARLYHQVRKGKEAKEHFVKANLRLVVSIAKSYPLPTGVDLLDVIQEGNIGLNRAVELFDWRKGFKFSTYARNWIRNHILRMLNKNHSLIKVPTGKMDSLRSTALRTANNPQTQAELNHEIKQLNDIKKVESLQAPLSKNGSNFDLSDLIADTRIKPEELVTTACNMVLLGETLNMLDERSKLVVCLHYGLLDNTPHTYREIGEVIGASSEYVRQILNKSLRVLRFHARDLDVEAA